MTLIERIAKRLGWMRQSSRAQAPSNNFQMANVNRLTASWTTTSASADSQARASLATVRARSRELRDNNDYAAKFISMVKTNVLGEAGVHFKSGVKDPDLVKGNKLITGGPDVFANKSITDSFWKWGTRRYCTVTGDMSWCDVQKVVIEAVATDGEHIIRKVRTNDPNNPFGFTLRLYEATRLDDTYNVMVGENGNEIRMGVELNMDGRRVAYHLLRNDPAESYFFRQERTDRERVPAEDIIHLGIIRRAGQTRYNPWMITSGYRMNMVGKYEESEAVSARVASAKMGFITNTGSSEYTGEKDTEGNKVMDAEPGAFEDLLPGQDIKVVDWQHPSTAYQAFIKTALRGVAAGLNVSYNSLANDMESVNFASGKLGLMEEREVWKSIQAWFIESFCEEVFSAWLYHCLSIGTIPLPFSKFEKFNTPIFRGRRWAYVNPSQDVDADIRQMNSGLTSISRLLAERNIDRDELFDEIQSDREALDSRGIDLLEFESKVDVAEASGAAALNLSGNSPEDRALEDFGITPKQFRKHVASLALDTNRSKEESKANAATA